MSSSDPTCHYLVACCARDAWDETRVDFTVVGGWTPRGIFPTRPEAERVASLYTDEEQDAWIFSVPPPPPDVVACVQPMTTTCPYLKWIQRMARAR